jgi:enoyl-CoA hydratase/3-hydroxyacyl-CoA dehydrogenase
MTRPHTTGVVGAGVMGRDVAGLLANAGFPVTLVDVDPGALEAAREYHRDRLADALRAGGLAVDGDPTDRISYAADTAALADAGFVVEAVPESLALKREVLADIEAVLDADAVVGTNTSSLTPGDVAADAAHPERVVLFHFANPALERDVVEIAGDDATDAAVETARTVAEAIDREPFVLGAEYRANCLSRLSASIKCAGTWELTEASAAAVDRGATRMGFDRGPIEYVDLVGVDVHLSTVDNLAGAYGDRYAPPPPVRERMEAMVGRGDLGKKAGRGFFEWDGDRALVPDAEDPHDVTPVVAALVNEAHRLVDDGVGDPDAIDAVLRRGSGGHVGPFDLEAALGTEFLRETLRDRHAETGAGVYEPAF